MSKKIKLVTPVQNIFLKDIIQSNSKILTLGSCFSDNIGNRLLHHCFDALVNPFGTVFNPISISKLLDLSLNERYIDVSELNSIGSRFFHYDFHSSYDNTDPEEVIKKINYALINTKSFIQSMDVLVLTFGTSVVYKLLKDERIVSNCHKVPNGNFTKHFLTVKNMEESMIEVINSIKAVNPSIQIILTVSPVRHIKEGLINNNVSKSRLIDLCYRLVQREKSITYFPSFEIIMDELRDYRYYRPDLIHPNEVAVDIIWNRVMESYFDDTAIQKVNDIRELKLAMEHKPFDSNSEGHRKFIQSQKKNIESLKVKYPEVDFYEFIQFFNA